VIIYYASYYRWLVIRDWIRVKPKDRVLDVGCDGAEILASVPGALKVGIDLNPRCPDHSVHLIQSDACALAISSGAFDTAFAFDIIEHIADDRAALSELLRVVSQDGTLWISTPSSGFFIFPRLLTACANRGWGHVRNGYTLEAIKEMLSPETTIEIMEWNAPALRLMHATLRTLDFSSSLTRVLAGLCHQIDKHLRHGLGGHLFIRIRKVAN
jgi:SAM-dependent methyltransferase